MSDATARPAAYTPNRALHPIRKGCRHSVGPEPGKHSREENREGACAMSAIRKQHVPRPSAGVMTYMNISHMAEIAKKNLGSEPLNEAGLYAKRLNAWHEKGKQLATQGNSTAWETADWLLGAASFDTRERGCYKEAAAILSLSVGCCRNYACVAKAFPPERRVTSEV